MILWTSPNGKWTIERIQKDGKISLMVSDGWRCDYPIMFRSGIVAYDKPERIPLYVKSKVKRILLDINKNRIADKAERLIKEAQVLLHTEDVQQFERYIRKYHSDLKVSIVRAPAGWPEDIFLAKLT